MITAGAISISYMMMVNHSLQTLHMSCNGIGDDGISTIARKLGNCKIENLGLRECGFTLKGAKSLAAALSFYPIKRLFLEYNPVTVEGAQLIVEAAVHNTMCLIVDIDDYMNDKVKEMLTILENRWRRHVRDWLCCMV